MKRCDSAKLARSQQFIFSKIVVNRASGLHSGLACLGFVPGEQSSPWNQMMPPARAGTEAAPVRLTHTSRAHRVVFIEAPPFHEVVENPGRARRGSLGARFLSPLAISSIHPREFRRGHRLRAGLTSKPILSEEPAPTNVPSRRTGRSIASERFSVGLHTRASWGRWPPAIPSRVEALTILPSPLVEGGSRGFSTGQIGQKKHPLQLPLRKGESSVRRSLPPALPGSSQQKPLETFEAGERRTVRGECEWPR
jgi:hypothetical protein